jgi:GNAT superfamily N-acetyltransferase
MAAPVSIRLDDDVLGTLDSAAKARGIGLATYLREIATAEARRVRRERIRAQSRAVAAYVAGSPEARQFYADWGTPTSKVEP